jgi:hypothetical protein
MRRAFGPHTGVCDASNSSQRGYATLRPFGLVRHKGFKAPSASLTPEYN